MTSSGTLPCGWSGHTVETDGKPGCGNQVKHRGDEGWLETEWSDGSTHEAMRPAGHRTTARQESEES